MTNKAQISALIAADAINGDDRAQHRAVMLATAEMSHVPRDDEEATITRAEAQNSAAYRTARAKAASEGKRLRIIDVAASAPPPEVPSRLETPFSDGRTLWTNIEYQKRLGIVRALAEADRQGLKYRGFRRAAELPDEARSIHDRLLADSVNLFSEEAD